MKLQITEYGRKRVASDDFAKCLVHVIAQASETVSPPEAMALVEVYTAMNLVVSEEGFVEVPANRHEEAEALTEFIDKNVEEIRKALANTMTSGAFLTHAFEVAGPPEEWMVAAHA